MLTIFFTYKWNSFFLYKLNHNFPLKVYHSIKKVLFLSFSLLRLSISWTNKNIEHKICVTSEKYFFQTIFKLKLLLTLELKWYFHFILWINRRKYWNQIFSFHHFLQTIYLLAGNILCWPFIISSYQLFHENKKNK